MADKKLNAVSTASDGAYVYAEDANGNQIKISKADLASVVAGLLSSNQQFPFMLKGYIGNANERIGSGFYRGTSENLNTPSLYGVLLVFAALGYVLQIFVVTGNNSYARMRNSIDNGVNWTDWIIF